MFSCKDGNKTIVEYLIDHGVNVNAESIYGDISLMFACESGDKALIKLLIDKGADVSKKIMMV